MRRQLRKASDRDEPSLLLRGRIPMVSPIQTLAVAEYPNFRHAANTLGVSLSSVSARVKTPDEGPWRPLLRVPRTRATAHRSHQQHKPAGRLGPRQ